MIQKIIESEVRISSIPVPTKVLYWYVTNIEFLS